jgi:hypothetical protein
MTRLGWVLCGALALWGAVILAGMYSQEGRACETVRHETGLRCQTQP